ncbi:MAG: hypothetical protein AABY22_14540 [Nanoarchaeota archaeon]
MTNKFLCLICKKKPIYVHTWTHFRNENGVIYYHYVTENACHFRLSKKEDYRTKQYNILKLDKDSSILIHFEGSQKLMCKNCFVNLIIVYGLKVKGMAQVARDLRIKFVCFNCKQETKTILLASENAPDWQKWCDVCFHKEMDRYHKEDILNKETIKKDVIPVFKRPPKYRIPPEEYIKYGYAVMAEK